MKDEKAPRDCTLQKVCAHGGNGFPMFQVFYL